MKNYQTLTLKELQKEIVRTNRELITSTLIARKQKVDANYEPILGKIRAIKAVLDARTGKTIRDSRPKKLQRKLGLLVPV